MSGWAWSVLVGVVEGRGITVSVLLPIVAGLGAPAALARYAEEMETLPDLVCEWSGMQEVITRAVAGFYMKKTQSTSDQRFWAHQDHIVSISSQIFLAKIES